MNFYSLHIPYEIDIDEIVEYVSKSQESINAPLRELVEADSGFDVFQKFCLDQIENNHNIFVSENEKFRSFYAPIFLNLRLKTFCKSLSKKHKDTYVFLVSTVYEDEIQFLLYKNGREIAQIKFDDVSEIGKSVNVEEFADLFNVSADDIEKALVESDCIFRVLEKLGKMFDLHLDWEDTDAKKNGATKIICK